MPDCLVQLTWEEMYRHNRVSVSWDTPNVPFVIAPQISNPNGRLASQKLILPPRNADNTRISTAYPEILYRRDSCALVPSETLPTQSKPLAVCSPNAGFTYRNEPSRPSRSQAMTLKSTKSNSVIMATEHLKNAAPINPMPALARRKSKAKANRIINSDMSFHMASSIYTSEYDPHQPKICKTTNVAKSVEKMGGIQNTNWNTDFETDADVGSLRDYATETRGSESGRPVIDFSAAYNCESSEDEVGVCADQNQYVNVNIKPRDDEKINANELKRKGVILISESDVLSYQGKGRAGVKRRRTVRTSDVVQPEPEIIKKGRRKSVAKRREPGAVDVLD